MAKSFNYKESESSSFSDKKEIKNQKKKNKRKDNKSLVLGEIGELYTIKKFLEHGYEVYKPIVDNKGVDLVVRKDKKFETIQVKSSSTAIDCKGSGTCFKLTYNRRKIKGDKYIQHAEKYNTEDVNYFSLYSEIDDEAYLIKNTGKGSITIRNKLSENKRGNQPSVIHMAEDYKIDNVLDLLDQGIDPDDIIDI